MTMLFCVFSFNRGRFLENCVRSIEQCVPSARLAVFDDNSDDEDTRQALDRIRARHAVLQPGKTFTHKLGGLYGNMQSAFEHARDEDLVCFIQDDMQVVRPVSQEEIRVISRTFDADEATSFCEGLKSASSLHDIGKIGIPDTILLKPSFLTKEEFEIANQHTVMGERILKDSSHSILQMAATVALNHHERWDGSGYPQGLRGKEVPLEGRIVMVVDQYDALRSKRPYKPPLSHDRAVEIITEGDGRTVPEHFDPAVLRAFIEVAPAFSQIFDSCQD